MKLTPLFFYISSLLYPAPARTERATTPPREYIYDYGEVSIPLGYPIPHSKPQIVGSPVSLLSGETTFAVRTSPAFSLPVDWDLVDQNVWGLPHHDYPAIDVLVPVGTPVFAVREGRVFTAVASDGGNCGGSVGLSTDIGNILTCHLSQVVIRYGDTVSSGDLIGYSGGKPGARGSGDSTAPHVHVQITRNGRLVCPQPLFLSLIRGQEPDLSTSTRCH